MSLNDLDEAVGYFLTQYPWLDKPIRIVTYVLLALLIAFLLKRLAFWLIKLGRLAPQGRKPSLERQKTLHSLLSSTIDLIVIILTVIASMSLFLDPNTIAWVMGLFSAAFGFGARIVIGDYLSGLSFLFEDTFSVGDKIEVIGVRPIEGVVETINIRTTMLRSPSGELYVVPNGEIRAVRNFSRGKFSIAKVTLKIQASDLGNALTVLETLGDEAVALLPNLIEPWQVTNLGGVTGQHTELTLIAKARFGKAAELRPRLLALVQERLTDVDVQLVN
ncbi:MAG TPA: mechanosensitive ion channel domain-containing protein [Anaerolineales bacterium]|nr:mechanosensitive ion channel domain-containing protein [Anaerolineales bacterium]